MENPREALSSFMLIFDLFSSSVGPDFSLSIISWTTSLSNVFTCSLLSMDSWEEGAPYRADKPVFGRIFDKILPSNSLASLAPLPNLAPFKPYDMFFVSYSYIKSNNSIG